MIWLEIWGFHKAVEQFCWDTCTVMDKRQTYSSVARTITMQVLMHNVTITTMMQLSSVKVSKFHLSLVRKVKVCPIIFNTRN